MTKSLRERFEAFVDRTGDHHLWTGAKRPDTGAGRLKVDGKHLPAHHLAWELETGPVPPGARVRPCPDVAACVRVAHLQTVGNDGRTLDTPAATFPRRRGRRGGGSMRQVAPGAWELVVNAGHYDDGRPRREYRRIRASDAEDAARQLAAFVSEIQLQPPASRRDERDLNVDDAIERFLSEHLEKEKGREPKTVNDYRRLHLKWFSPAIGARRVRDIDEAAIDKIFGDMRRAGLSKSRMNQAKSLYGPFFRWAKKRRLTPRNPMLEFDLPTSKQVSRERTPPEADELSTLLNAALVVVPEVAPLLTLGAVTGMRRGELVGVRRSRILWDEGRLTVDVSIDGGRRVKGTKTRTERTFYVDAATMEMLRRHCDEMDRRATDIGVVTLPDAFVFSLVADCSAPMLPDYVSKRVAVLKDHLGIADKRPATIELEDEALRQFRQPRAPRPNGKRGPAPRGGSSFREIGERLGRSERWAALAVASAERRETAFAAGGTLNFDGSILALRKFTSSELLDAGFNISMVAQRQGHGPQVLMKHYAKSRRSADRRAADHLGSVVHGSAR